MAHRNDKQRGILARLDWFTIVVYIALLAMGWMSVCGASYDFDQQGNFFDFGTRSGMQVVWIGTSFVLATLILLVSERVYEVFAYVLYAAFMVLLLATPFLAHDIKGSMSWIKIGSFSIQPAEFAKFATALCLAKYACRYEYSMLRWRDAIISIAIVLLPMALIVLQKETGSALVYAAFFLVLYREGMYGSILFAGISAVIYFVVGIRFAEVPMWGILPTSLGEFVVLMLIIAFTLILTLTYTATHRDTMHMALIALAPIGGLLFARYIIPFNAAWIALGACGAIALYLIYLSLRERMWRYFILSLFTLGSLGFSYACSYVLDNVLQEHQQTRIRVLLGMEDDPRGAGYNVLQAQIAIGSGGLKGKGFLKGTQTKLKYVPEQDTDFIFCTVGEEEGFIGCSVVIGLFLILILRLIHLAERQSDTMARVYGYSVMSIFLFHVAINMGMVLGLTPVIGIPLPFFSYGGSSLWGFTILLFVFLRMDMERTVKA
ncbi:MAG: rod shape-determining protein RodA [Bacteroidaceae bacterium]|nr:rod shape-determining protein RodA [Bacteroidaceae bacterium]